MRNPKNIQDAAVARCKYSCVENIQSERSHHPGYRGEQAWPVAGADHDRTTVAIRKMLDRSHCPITGKLSHQNEVSGNFTLARSKKVAFRHDLQELIYLCRGIILQQLVAHSVLDTLQAGAHVLPLKLTFLHVFENG